MGYVEFELLNEHNNPRHLKMNDEECYDVYVWRDKWRNKIIKNPHWFKLKIKKCSKYNCININKKHYLLHRVNYYIHNPEWDIYDNSKNNEIDHIDRNPLNNHISNLRVVTHSQNSQNTDAKGYCYDKRRNKYLTRITINGKQKTLGRYDTEQEAREIYLKYKKENHSYYIDKNNN